MGFIHIKIIKNKKVFQTKQLKYKKMKCMPLYVCISTM